MTFGSTRGSVPRPIQMRRRSSTLELPLPKPHPIPGGFAPPLRVAGLFAGIGGIEVGLSDVGHEATLLCEIEPGARAVLQKRFPEVELHDDVAKLSSLPGETDLLAAGFPCQDLSQAGKAVGIDGTRSSLVGEVFRLLRKRATPWVLLENVPFMLQLAQGRAMDVIVSEIERLGYQWAYRIVNSRAFGLPQRRERVILLASRNEDPRSRLFADNVPEPIDPEDVLGELACGFYWTEGTRGLGWAVDAIPTLKSGSTVGIPSPPAIVLPNGSIVTPNICDAERMQGFEPGWTDPAESVVRASHRWKLVGNAVTVDVARWLGERLRTASPPESNVEGFPLRSGSSWPCAAWNVGKGRYAAIGVSSFPVYRPRKPLHRWLKFQPALLSEKATAGFLRRAETTKKLRFPAGFLMMVREHLATMRRGK